METTVIDECSKRSLAGTITFGEVVQRLTAAGLERYRTDLVRRENCYYAPDGDWTTTVIIFERSVELAERFSAPDIGGAVREIQQSRINYQEFLRRIAAAGCCCYTVFLREGRMVVYEGRGGETHIEKFPPTSR